MMSSHVKLFHKPDRGKASEETEDKVCAEESGFQKPQEPIVRLVKTLPSTCQENVGEKSIRVEKKRKVANDLEDENRNTKQSPKKRPRNIRINVCDILKKFKKVPVSDQYLIDLSLKMMHGHSRHPWSQAKNSNGEIDGRESVIKTLIEEHLSGCEHCRNTVRADPQLNWKLESQVRRNPETQAAGDVSRFRHTQFVNKHQLEKELIDKFEIRGLKEMNDKLLYEIRTLKNSMGIDVLKEVSKPVLNPQNAYTMVKGYKLIDTNQMGLALKLAQECHHGTLILVENLSLSVQVDLATQMGFVCTTCGAQTMFTTSKFNTEKPSNFSINKHLMRKLGKTAYHKLVEEVEMQGGQRIPIKFKKKQGMMPKPKLILGYDFVKPYPKIVDPKNPQPSSIVHSQNEPEKDVDPLELAGENIEPSELPELTDNGFDPCHYDPASPTFPKGENEDLGSIAESEDLREDQTPDNAPAENGIQDCESIAVQDFDRISDQDPSPEPDNIDPETNERPSNDDQQSHDSIDDLLKDDQPSTDEHDELCTPNPVLKIRAFKDLQQEKMDIEPSQPVAHSWTITEGAPPEDPKPLTCSDIAPNTRITGGVVTPVRPGVKIVSSNVIRSTTTESQLPRGVYRFRPDKGNDAILVVGIEPTNKPMVLAKAAPTLLPLLPRPLLPKIMTPMTLYVDRMMSKETSKNERDRERLLKLREQYKKQWLSLSEESKQFYRVEAAEMNSVTVQEPEGISLSDKINANNEDSGGLPKGWKRNIHSIRGYKVVTVSTPDGRAFTEKEELKKYVEDNFIDLDLDLINFSPHVSYLPHFSMPISDSGKRKQLTIQGQTFVNLNLESVEGFTFPRGVWVPLMTNNQIDRVHIPLGYRSDEFDPPQIRNSENAKQRFLMDPEGKKQNMPVQMIINEDGEKHLQIPSGYKLMGDPENDYDLGAVWKRKRQDEQRKRELKEAGIYHTPLEKDDPGIPPPDPTPSSQLPVLDNANLFDDYDEEVLINDGHL